VRYALLNREIETNGILETARELGVTILAYSPLAQGLLTGKYRIGVTTDTNRPTGARKIDSRFKPEGLAKIEPLLKLLEEIGAKYDRTIAQVALNWLIFQSNDKCQVIPIPGAKTAKQAEQNAGALGWSINHEEADQLNQASKSKDKS
jgi:aryl-alcohol dehydrogenase-like predicted oxidoreductase